MVNRRENVSDLLCQNDCNGEQISLICKNPTVRLDVNCCDPYNEHTALISEYSPDNSFDTSTLSDDSRCQNVFKENLLHPYSRQDDSKGSRSFSVVPVCNLKYSPNTNLVHEKLRERVVTAITTDSDTSDTDEETTDLPTPNGRLDSSTNRSPFKFPERQNTNIDNKSRIKLSSQNNSRAATNSTRNDVSINLDKNASKKPSRTAPVSLTSLYQEPALSTADTSIHNDIRAATRFPRVELEENILIPSHYITFTSGNEAPRRKLSVCNYLTVQPPRVRKVNAKNRVDFLKNNDSPYLTELGDGRTMVHYGSTDGRKITFHSGVVMDKGKSVGTGLEKLYKDDQLHTVDPDCGEHITVSSPSSPSSPTEKDTVLTLYQTTIHKEEQPGRQEDLVLMMLGENKTPNDDEVEERPTWTTKLRFLLACIGSCVGLGNFWRFPYLCYKSGGGAFLIPYTIMLFVCGVPLLLMEMAIGQYTRQGPVGALQSLCPIFIGSSVGVVVISTIFCSYYNIIISWSLYYLFQSFRSMLPWTSCSPANVSTTSLCMNSSGKESPTQIYFDDYVLQKSSGIEDYGDMVLPLLGCVIIAWILVYFSIWKSVKSSGVVVLFTATVPYLFILAFLVRAVTLEGAGDGLKFLFMPDWSLLLEARVWVNAAAQNFNSIGIAFGALITFSSYNKFENNILSDVWVISMVNAGTSILAGIIVFSTMGNIALETGRNITDVVAEGPGLAFVVYPQALAKMPYPNGFSIAFFLLLLMLGIDSQFATVEVIVTCIKDAFPGLVKRYIKRHEVLTLFVCIFCFLIGLPNLFQGGIYWFSLLDYYSAGISLMYLAFFEVVAVVWVYGADNLCRNIKHMTGRLPSAYFKFCWYFFSPLLISIIAVFSWVDYKEPTYDQGAYTFPPWAIGLGWTMASLSLIPIPLFMVIQVYRARGDTLREKFLTACRPTLVHCPNCCRPRAIDCSGAIGDCCRDLVKAGLSLTPNKSPVP
uniref:Transporter n=1 Tax=Grandidierella japonica TaxID=429032 RepID=A0A4D6YRW8_GRAJA|nr:sodium- and chloride-dependent GABA transporter ine [Grandidierella japonica]